MNFPLPPDMMPLVMTYLVVLFRVAAMVAFIPALSEASIPPRVKLAVAFVLSLIIVPAIDAPFALDQVKTSEMIAVVASETAIGAFLGLILRVFMYCLQITGSIAAQSTSLSQILGMAGVEPLPAMGHVITMAGLTLAVMFGLHVSAAEYMIASYVWMVPGEWPDTGAMVEMMVGQIASGFQLAFSLAAPFFILSLLYNLTLGVINRAMPQLMVAFVGAPVITAGALFLLVVTIPLVLSTWHSAFVYFITTLEVR